jgi:hypothetical protein
VRVPDEDWIPAVEVAQHLGRSASDVVRAALREFNADPGKLLFHAMEKAQREGTSLGQIMQTTLRNYLADC